MMRYLFMICMFMLASMLWGKENTSPTVLYLTWQHDPTKTMMIHWHTVDDADTWVEYRKIGERAWEIQEGIAVRLPESKVRVHTVELMDLEEDTLYEFRVQDTLYRFRTLSATLNRPLRFVVGGDAYFHLDTFRKMNGQIAAHNPDFVIVGGDIAYTCGISAWTKSPLQRWHVFFKEWKQNLVTRDGRLIPMIPVIGNHDVRGTSFKRLPSETIFYELFAFLKNGIAFRVIDIGNYLSLFLLDSGHSCQVTGMQADWLKEMLSVRENRPYKIAAYHVGGYPTYYPFSDQTAREIREEWSCLFERYHLSVAFEHHNHAYKRTYPLKDGRIDPDGVVYLGDGSWGISPRKTHDMWYLKEHKKANAVCVVTLSETAAEVEAIKVDGNRIDSITLHPTPSQTAFEKKRWLQY